MLSVQVTSQDTALLTGTVEAQWIKMAGVEISVSVTTGCCNNSNDNSNDNWYLAHLACNNHTRLQILLHIYLDVSGSNALTHACMHMHIH